jgi:hypothetical protein
VLGGGRRRDKLRGSGGLGDDRLRDGSRRHGCGGIRDDELRRDGGLGDDAGLTGGSGRQGCGGRGEIAVVSSRRQYSDGIRDGGLRGGGWQRGNIVRKEERPGNVSKLGEGARLNELGGDGNAFWFGYT